MKINTEKLGKNPLRRFFSSIGYGVIEIDHQSTDPSFMVEKDGVKRTVDVVEWFDSNRSLSHFVYDRIMDGGFFVIMSSVEDWSDDIMYVYTKNDIKDVAKTYHILWMD